MRCAHLAHLTEAQPDFTRGDCEYRRDIGSALPQNSSEYPAIRPERLSEREGI
jgi:hypothetical protein